MAIKTFTAGSVLTASDTNTFLANAGLVYIDQKTFTGATSVDFTSVFTSTYADYRIEFQELTATVGGEFLLRLRDSGGIISTSNYLIQRLESVAASVDGIGSGAVSAFFPTYVNASSNAAAGVSGYLDIFQPQVSSAYTRISGQFCRSDNTGSLYQVNSTGLFNLTTVCTGFSLVRHSTATLSGTVRVYGLRTA